MCSDLELEFRVRDLLNNNKSSAQTNLSLDIFV